MGWYVELLILNRDEIRESVLNELSGLEAGGILSNSVLSTNSALESDEFNDLLLVEREIDKFTNNNLISEKELEVMNLVMNSPSFNKAQFDGDYSRPTISKIFRDVCDRISFSLGGVFTNEGFLEHMRFKYHLTSEEVVLLEKYLLSKYRHRLMTKPYTKG